MRADDVPGDLEHRFTRAVQRHPQQLLLVEAPLARAFANLNAAQIFFIAGAQPLEELRHAGGVETLAHQLRLHLLELRFRLGGERFGAGLAERGLQCGELLGDLREHLAETA